MSKEGIAVHMKRKGQQRGRGQPLRTL